MKFIHTGDIHWGMSPDSDKPWSRERARDIRDTFAAIIEKTRKTGADCLFIAGDLFHRQPLQKDLKEVNYLFSTIPGVRVIIIAGNHDRIRLSSAVLSFSWCPNVTFIDSEELTSYYFRDINTEVTGQLPYCGTRSRVNQLMHARFTPDPYPIGHGRLEPHADRQGRAGRLRIFLHSAWPYPQAGSSD
ncbi:MAG: metallophosphoesterase family protein [[Clostridium] symbiosum]